MSYLEAYRKRRLRLAEIESDRPRCKTVVQFGKCRSTLVASDDAELERLRKDVNEIHVRHNLNRGRILIPGK